MTVKRIKNAKTREDFINQIKYATEKINAQSRKISKKLGAIGEDYFKNRIMSIGATKYAGKHIDTLAKINKVKKGNVQLSAVSKELEKLPTKALKKYAGVLNDFMTSSSYKLGDVKIFLEKRNDKAVQTLLNGKGGVKNANEGDKNFIKTNQRDIMNNFFNIIKDLNGADYSSDQVFMEAIQTTAEQQNYDLGALFQKAIDKTMKDQEEIKYFESLATRFNNNGNPINGRGDSNER